MGWGTGPMLAIPPMCAASLVGVVTWFSTENETVTAVLAVATAVLGTILWYRYMKKKLGPVDSQ